MQLFNKREIWINKRQTITHHHKVINVNHDGYTINYIKSIPYPYNKLLIINHYSQE